MIVNVFDSNFRQAGHSTLNQTPERVEYVWEQREFDGLTLFTDEWAHNPIVDEVQSRYKVAWLREPYCLHTGTYDRHPAIRHKFDLTLTYDQGLLNLDPPHYYFCPYAGSWIERHNWGLKNKTRDVSMLVGAKAATQGHRIRLAAALRVEDQAHLYGALGTKVGYGQDTKIRTLAPYRFSIITETCYEDNLFTEWLLDAFTQGTVPVYWGLPNAADFFNADGILAWESLDDLDAILPELTPKLYAKMLPAVRDNLERAGEYACTEDWLYRNLLKGWLEE